MFEKGGLLRKIIQLLQFAASGIPGSVVAAGIFIGLTEGFTVPYWHSLVFARVINTAINFCVQQLLLYRGKYTKQPQLIAEYFFSSALLITINVILLRFLVEQTGIHYIVAQALLILPLTYIAEKIISTIFQRKRRP